MTKNETAPQEVEQAKNPDPIVHNCIFAVKNSLDECLDFARELKSVLDTQMTKQQNGKWLFKATCLASQ